MLMTITLSLFVISLMVEMYFFLVARSCHYHNSLDENMNIVLRDQSGIIKTPLYQYGDHGQSSYSDQRYKRHSLEDHQCHWKIIAPKGKVLRVDFSSFRLYDYYRYVEIADRINGMNRRIIKRTGILPSFTFYSWGNELSIYINDYEYYYTGFSANYTTVPAGENKRYPLYVSSPTHSNWVRPRTLGQFFPHTLGEFAHTLESVCPHGELHIAN